MRLFALTLLLLQVTTFAFAAPARELLSEASVSDDDDTKNNTPTVTWIAMGVTLGAVIVCICGGIWYKTRYSQQ